MWPPSTPVLGGAPGEGPLMKTTMFGLVHIGRNSLHVQLSGHFSAKPEPLPTYQLPKASPHVSMRSVRLKTKLCPLGTLMWKETQLNSVQVALHVTHEGQDLGS